MRVIGLVGGIGAGKSTVAKAFKALGCRVLDADHIAHEVLDDPEVVAAIVDRFGDSICGASGRVDRLALGTRVFSNADDLAFLESLVHPRVKHRCEQAIQSFRGSDAVVVLDAPLLLETNLDEWCDAVVFVEASEATRLARLAERSGWDAEEVARRAAHQLGLDEKRSRSHHVLVNAGDSESLRQQVSDLLSHLQPRHD